jgi:6-phosphogluconolactonase
MGAANKAKPIIERVSDSEELAKTAHDMFIRSATEAISGGRRFHVAISGGHTPTRLFELLGESPQSLGLDWGSVEMFWVDERCVPPNAEASNYHLAASTFLDKVSIPAENVHRVCGECIDYSHAVQEYQETIRRVFKLRPGDIPEFDLIVLGMGADGHIGSLFPNSYALFETEDLASVVYMTGGDYGRITLTNPVICAAKSIMILVCGAEKAETLKDVLGSEPDHIKYPVHRLWPILHRVTWIVDDDAGKYL